MGFVWLTMAGGAAPSQARLEQERRELERMRAELEKGPIEAQGRPNSTDSIPPKSPREPAAPQEKITEIARDVASMPPTATGL